MTVRKSAALKALQGTARRDRALKVGGGERLMVAPHPPVRLGPTAAEEWRTLAAAFVSAGTLAATDLAALAMLCEALGDEREARETIARDGWTIPGLDGARKQHPAVRQGENARALAIRLLEQFGATPHARQGVAQAPRAGTAAADTAEAFLADSQWTRLKRLQAGSLDL